MIGMLGLCVALQIHSLYLYAGSLGLVADEMTYLAIGGKTHSDNYSVRSLAGTAGIVVVVFALRGVIFRLVS
jgi:hypothetical protein